MKRNPENIDIHPDFGSGAVNSTRHMRGNLLTVPQVAEMLAVSPSTIYSWVSFGYLPAVVMGRGTKKPVVRFRPEAIEQFISTSEREHKDSIDKANSEKEDFRKKVAHLTRKLNG